MGRPAVRLWLLVVALAVVRPSPASLSGGAQPTRSLPPISYVCPMPQDVEVLEDKPGTCPRCGMTLSPVRLDSRWSCPVHTTVVRDQAGPCPICRRDLVRVTVSVFWTCAAQPKAHELAPGACADGTPRAIAYERRAHGDHNPRHGGQFFMASDNWHHLEGTYPEPGVFRVFIYDDYTRPVAVSGMSGRAAIDARSVTLHPSTDGTSLEARVDRLAFPAHITANVKFSPKSSEQRFDFTFASLTKEPDRLEPAPTSARSTLSTPGNIDTSRLPSTTAGLIEFINERNDDLKRRLDQGSLGDLWIPALESKEAALALEAHAAEWPADRRAAVSRAVRDLVIAAWRIDRFGDMGDKPQLVETYRMFAAAIGDLNRAYARQR